MYYFCRTHKSIDSFKERKSISSKENDGIDSHRFSVYFFHLPFHFVVILLIVLQFCFDGIQFISIPAQMNVLSLVIEVCSPSVRLLLEVSPLTQGLLDLLGLLMPLASLFISSVIAFRPLGSLVQSQE